MKRRLFVKIATAGLLASLGIAEAVDGQDALPGSQSRSQGRGGSEEVGPGAC